MELIGLVNFVIIFLSQTTLLRSLTLLLGSQIVIVSPAHLDFFLSSDASVCATMDFPLLVNSDHVVVSVYRHSIKLTTGSPFHRIACDYSCADWDSLCDPLKDVLWKDILKLSASAAASEFLEWVQVGIDVYISHRKYQIKPHSSPWFSAACAAAIGS